MGFSQLAHHYKHTPSPWRRGAYSGWSATFPGFLQLPWLQLAEGEYVGVA